MSHANALPAGETQVVAASQQLLSALQPTIASIAVPHGADPQREEPEDDDDVRPELTATATASALAGYAAQLVLTWLAAAARRLLASPSGPPAAATAAASPAGVKGARKGGGGGKRESSGRAEDAAGEGVGGVFDLALVVRVAREAPDGLARNAALGLLSLLAGLAPRQALDHALQVRDAPLLHLPFLCFAFRSAQGGWEHMAVASEPMTEPNFSFHS